MAPDPIADAVGQSPFAACVWRFAPFSLGEPDPWLGPSDSCGRKCQSGHPWEKPQWHIRLVHG